MAAVSSSKVGTAYVVCPVCEEEVPVVVTATVTGTSGRTAYLVCEPDMSDMYAHAWTHEQ